MSPAPSVSYEMVYPNENLQTVIMRMSRSGGGVGLVTVKGVSSFHRLYTLSVTDRLQMSYVQL